MKNDRLAREEEFHNQWAKESLSNLPDPIQINEALTSPELRWIHSQIGDFSQKKILDIGCGRGETSVYFAIKGAHVTALDLSSEMINATQVLAQKHKVSLKTVIASADNFNLPTSEKFDFIYLGNLFHHVDIGPTILKVLPYLKDNGSLVSWDPIAYNPLINIYRKIATSVRTPDEHPLTQKDVKLITSHFEKSRIEFFWFFTLIIFIMMALFQGKNPNKVRYWKNVVEDAEKWRWIYEPLVKADQYILKLFPPLQWLCWNVAMVCSKPKKHTGEVSNV